MSNPPPNARTSPSTARNRDPILTLLRAHLPRTGLILEIASGAGEHAAYFAAHLPNIEWQPTDPDPTALQSIAAWRTHASLPNLRPPMLLDATTPETWPIAHTVAIVNINMIHISPWQATLGLMKGAARLPPNSPLILYGPYFEANHPQAPSNQSFNATLRSRNPAWGVRRLEDVVSAAQAEGLKLLDRVEMPRDNLALVFKKT